jgi:hypothetical protein
MRHDLFGLGDLKNLDVAVLQLHNAVVGAPGVAVAATDGKSGTDVEFRRSVDVTDRVHDVVETVGHPI